MEISMKIKFNTKSNTVAVYCILVFAACLFLVALVFKYNTFLYYIHKIIKVLSPIIWGIVFAYILNPFVILCDKHLKKLFRRTKKCRSIRDRKSTRLNSSHDRQSRMPSSA